MRHRHGLTESQAGKLGYASARASIKEYLDSKTKKALAEFKFKNLRCTHCTTPIPFEKRNSQFCGHNCAKKHNNPLRAKRHSDRKCRVCGDLISSRRGKVKYCSPSCYQEEVWAGKKARIELEGRVYSITEAKRYLQSRYGYQCTGINDPCGVREWRGARLTLVLDHIDGNASNWSLDNIRLLCPNCNSQTPTFTGRNKGNGRKWRRDRYLKATEVKSKPV